MVAALMPPLYSLRLGSPVPRQEIVEPVDIVIVDTCEYIRKPGLRINIIEFGRVNERQHHCRALTAAIGAGEQPGLPAKRNSAQLAFGGIVAQADAAVIEEAGKDVDALEHVVESLRHFVVARELAALPLHPFDEIIDQRRDVLAAHSDARFGR